MPCKIDLMGQRFSRLVVTGERGRRPVGKNQVPWIVWAALCDCGNEIECFAADLRGGNTKSCGCLQREKVIAKNFVHGDNIRTARTPEYRVWAHLVERCENPNDASFHNYGGRGISVCARWRSSFVDFLADMGRRPSPKHMIDREDNDGNYEPGNCRWVTRSVQNKNRRPFKRDARGRCAPREPL